MNFNVLPATTSDYRLRAKQRLPKFLFDYIDGGANKEITLAVNCSDFDRYTLKQQVLRDVSNVDTSTVLSGKPVSMPLALAPIGMAGMMARRGETLGARAAKNAGVPFTLSTVGVCSAEEVKTATNTDFWFQLYMLRDRKAVQSIVDRAQAVGCDTLVFTVDLPIAGMRHRDQRNGMASNGLLETLTRASQLLTHPRWAFDVGLHGRPHTIGNLSDLVQASSGLSDFKNFIDSQFDASVTRKDIDWLRSIWPGRLILKGIMEIDDAQRAVETGADAIIVSNHGGRQLDSVGSSLSKLPDIADTVGDQIEVFMDGGIRNGIDVIKAVALGAKGVLIGRPWIWAVAGSGEAGLTQLLNTFQQEMAVAMALMGVTRIDQLDRGLLE